MENWEKILKQIEKKKKYWHIRWEGIDDLEERKKRKEFNEEVTMLINSVIDDILDIIGKNKLYTQEELDRARKEGYDEGFDDCFKDLLYKYDASDKELFTEWLDEELSKLTTK